MNNTNNNIVEKHAKMRAYLHHRQRVLEMKPRVDTCRTPIRSSKSVQRTSSVQELAEKSKIQKENIRLLDSLIQISKRKSELGSYAASSISRSKSCSRSSMSSANSPLNKLQR